jgi:hypothetical protein
VRSCVLASIPRGAPVLNPSSLLQMFGFLFIVFVILIITCAEITIVMCYFQLCNEVSAAD